MSFLQNTLDNLLKIRIIVLNKYFPPDFDPELISRRKGPRNSQQVVRLMAPFSMYVDYQANEQLTNLLSLTGGVILVANTSTRAKNSMPGKKQWTEKIIWELRYFDFTSNGESLSLTLFYSPFTDNLIT